MSETLSFYDKNKGRIAIASAILSVGLIKGGLAIGHAYGTSQVMERVDHDLNFIDSPLNYGIEELVFGMFAAGFAAAVIAVDRGAKYFHIKD